MWQNVREKIFDGFLINFETFFAGLSKILKKIFQIMKSYLNANPQVKELSFLCNLMV